MEFEDVQSHIHIIAHIHIIEFRGDDLSENGSDGFVKRADAVDHQIASGNGVSDALGVFRVKEREGYPARRVFGYDFLGPAAVDVSYPESRIKRTL